MAIQHLVAVNIIKMQCDNHHRNDNRKQFLRIVTSSQNKMNNDKPRNNTSGVRGVWYSKKIKRWIAEIGINNQKVYLGSYQSLEEAKQAREAAEEKYFGDFNFCAESEVMNSYDNY